MGYNYLREANTIHNSTLCFHDTNAGYKVNWYENGNLEGWDTYYSVHTYGVWNNVLFGTSFGGDCYIGNPTQFDAVPAESYYIVKIQMKIVVVDQDRSHITGGKLQWLSTSDTMWNDDKSIEFDVYTDDTWHLYEIIVGEKQYWQGDIRNLRLYPFLNSRRGDQFFIRSVSIISPDTYTCTQQACSYYSQYEHPCPGSGAQGQCVARDPITSIDIVEDVNDSLIINIDGYGNQPIKLLPRVGMTPNEVAKELEREVTKIDLGGYTNATVVANFYDKLELSSGTFADDSSVSLAHTQLAEDLGFFDGSSDVSTKTTGTDPATLFEFQSTYRLRGVEIFKLMDGSKESVAFYHNPDRYEVEAGREDWQEKANTELGSEPQYEDSHPDQKFDGDGLTLIDFTHPFNNSGLVKKVFLMGEMANPDVGGKVKFFRPAKDGTLTLVDEVAFGTDNVSYIYSKVRDTYVVDVEYRARKGDLVGFYNVNLYLGDVVTDIPDAMYYSISGDATGTFTPGQLIGHGNFGPNYYCRGDNRQDTVLLDIDFGERVNIRSILFYGEEKSEDFEFNVAICDDINWTVNLMGGTHSHYVDDAFIPENSYYVTHDNIAYGVGLLSDGITHTEDGALAGTSYGDGVNNDGFFTVGTTYFYVNGDAEWINEVPGEHPGNTARYTVYPPTNFDRDPIEFNLVFRDEKTIHRTVLYFKDRRNFVNFHWSYYLGEFARYGNTYDDQYSYIPAYTKISLDTVEFDSDTADSFVRAYLFENPTSGDYSSYYNEGTGRTEVSNPEVAYGSSILRWNILGHEFEPITTKAIRFYTDRHVSTKMMEIEAYSMVPNNASLLDDVYVTYSKEGDYWNGAVFREETIEGEEVANAMINDTPRYITLEIRSSSTIAFNEFEIELEERSVAIGDTKCLEELHLPESKTGKVNQAIAVKIWNTHDEEADLRVDIPYDYGDNRMILWTTLEDDDAVELPEVGPGGTYYKNDDYPIQNDDYQVAINCPSYGLKNLAVDKSVYFSEEGESWETVTSSYNGGELNIGHLGRRISSFEFTPVSAPYFRITGSTNKNPAMSDIGRVIAFYDGDEVEFDSFESTNSPPQDDDFGDGVLAEFWTPTMVTSPASYSENTGYLEIYSSYGGGFSPTSTWPAFIWQAVDGDFEIYAEFELPDGNLPGPDYENCGLYFELQEMGDTSHNAVIMWRTYASSNKREFSRYKNGTYSVSYATWSATHFWYKLKRVGTTITGYYSTNGVDWNSMGSDSYSQWGGPGYIGLMANHSLGGAAYRVWVRDFVVVSNTPSTGDQVLHNDDKLDITFASAEAVDGFRLYHDTIEQDPQNSDWENNLVDIYVSYDDIVYTYWDTALWMDEYNEEVESFLAFDLEKRYALDFIRHYGENSDDFDITDYKLYFNDETSDPNDLEPSGELTEWIYQGASKGAAYSSSGSDPHADFGTDYDGTGLMYGGSTRFRSVVKFVTMPTLPTDLGYIVDYNLELYIDKRYGNNTNTEVHLLLYECLFDWPEDESGNYWNPTPGVQIGTTIVGEVIYPDVFSDWPIYWAEIALNSAGQQLVDDWISGAKDNYGFYVMEYHDYINGDVYPIESRVAWRNDTYTNSAYHPRLRIVYRSSNVDTGSIDDCRWPIISIPETKSITKIGIYPNVSYVDAPGGGYNSEWDDLGTILADYNAKENVAYDATISGSSTFFDFVPGFVVDGVIPDEDITKCWGTDDSTTQWLKIYLDALYTIDEVRCYWGYHTGDDRFMVTDYTISTSLDDVDYLDQIDITGNDEFVRHHVFDSPVQARYVKIDINDYDAGTVTVRTGLGTYEDFSGALVREVEVLEALTTSHVSHHDYPVVCIDLKTRFNIDEHDITSPYPDFTESYWNNDNSYFRYSNSFFDEPEKIVFTGYGASLPRDAKWVLIMNDDEILGGPETFSTDFSEYDLYAEPDDWYVHYPPGGYTWEITDATANPLLTSDRVMRVALSVNDDFRFIWDIVPQESEVEILGLVLTPSEGRNDSPAIIGRGSLTWDLGDQQGYWADAHPNSDEVSLSRYIPGSFYNNTFSVSAGVDGDSWYWIRMRLEGTTQYLKAWKYGDTEPVSWDGTDTDAVLTDAGWVGVYFSTSAYNAYWAWFSVGIRGFSAPHPDDPVVSEIEERINDGYNFLDNLLVYSTEKDAICDYPWWWSSRFSTVSTDYSIHSPETIQSLKIEYTGGPTTSGIEELYFIEGASFGTDDLFSERDRLGFNLYIDDISNLDTSYGEISFGDIQGLRYHTWDFSTVASELSTGWNEIKLKFSAAETQVTNYGQETPADTVFNDLNNYNDLDLRSFKFKFRGKGDPLTLYIDDIKIDRTRFEDDVKFGQGLYLCNTEYLSFPLSDYDTRKCSIKLYLRPDYSFAGSDSFRQAISRTWFCFTNVANDIFGVFVSPPRGPSIVVGNSNEVKVIKPAVTPTDDRYFSVDEVCHVGFVWSYDGTQINSHGTTAALFINGSTVGTTTETWEVSDSKSSRLLIGGTLSQKAANRGTTSIWGVVDNLKVYNYCKSDFSDRNFEGYETVDVVSPNSFLEISQDGVNFYNRDSSQLPLEYEDVPAGESRVVWVRTNIPADLTGKEQRTAQLIVEAIRSF